MSIFLLPIGVGLALLVIAAYRLHPLAVLSLVGCYGILTSVCVLYTAPSLLVTYACVLLAWAGCRWRGVSTPVFAAWSFAAVSAGALLAMATFVPRWLEIRRLAERYPVTSMGERLAYERQPGFSPRGKPGDDGGNYEISQRIQEAERAGRPWWQSRENALASLESMHGDFVTAFANQEGFGLERIGFNTPPDEAYLALPEPAPIPLPFLSSSTSAGDVAGPFEPVPDTAPFSMFHDDRTIEFVNPPGFGSALDLEWTDDGFRPATRVRGFQPHAFRDIADRSPAGDEWQLTKLELVSLLKHDPPAVYVSEHLPRMQDLASANAPTRPLDGFESGALTRLLEGVTVHAEEGRNRIRMLGGLRAATQCRQCHSVGERHLLGAFSYEFRRKEPLPAGNGEPVPKRML